MASKERSCERKVYKTKSGKKKEAAPKQQDKVKGVNEDAGK